MKHQMKMIKHENFEAHFVSYFCYLKWILFFWLPLIHLSMLDLGIIAFTKSFMNFQLGLILFYHPIGYSVYNFLIVSYIILTLLTSDKW